MSNIATEHLGLAAVHRGCAEMNAIWRPTPANDLGIDGQIELLENDSTVSSGLVLAAQVKSGMSYFSEIADDAAVVYPTDRQRAYWSQLMLPVICILHNPEKEITIFADVKPQLGDGKGIRVPLVSRFGGSARDGLIAIASRYHGANTPQHIAERLQSARLSVTNGQTITGIEYFIACTNLEQGYFELRMSRLLPLFGLAQKDDAVSLGQSEYDWILRCTLICWATHLVDRFEDVFEYWWYDQQMVPDIAVPLMGLGRQTLEFVLENAPKYVAYDALGAVSVEHSTDIARTLMATCQAASDRHDRTDRLGEHPM